MRRCMQAKPFRDEFIDRDEWVVSDQILGDTTKQPCRAGHDHRADREMQAEQAFSREPGLYERELPRETASEELHGRGDNHV